MNKFDLVNSSAEGLTAILKDDETFYRQNWENNCKKLLSEELYLSKIDRIKSKVQKDFFLIIKDMGTHLQNKGEMVTSAYLSRDEDNFNLSLVEFFFKMLREEYGEIFVRYRELILSMIPRNTEDILRMMKEEFGKVRNILINKAAKDFTNYSKKLAVEIIKKKTGINSENLKQIEEIFNLFFPKAGKTYEKYIFNILFNIEQSFEGLASNFEGKQIENFEQGVINFKNSVEHLFHSFSENLKISLAKIFGYKWVDCSYNQIAEIIVKDLISQNLLNHNIYSENFYACKEKLDDQEKNKKTYKIIFSINKVYCEILAFKILDNSIIFAENQEPDYYSKLSCFKLTEENFNFNMGLTDINDEDDQDNNLLYN